MSAVESVRSFSSARRIELGPGSAGLAGEHAAKLGGNKALIVTDQGVRNAGLLEPILRSLETSRVAHEIFDGVEAEPTIDLADRCGATAREGSFDLIIGVGGGSCLDVAKATAVLAGNSGSTRDFFGWNRVPKPGLPKILIPTTSGTGSEVNQTAVFKDPLAHTKNAINGEHVEADVALVDPRLTITMPRRMTAFTGIDALSHAIESYTSTIASPVTDALSAQAIAYVARYLPRACANGQDIVARYNMSAASMLAGMAAAQAGVAAVHALSYPLGMDVGMPHGLTTALLLAPVMELNMVANYEKYAQIAYLLGCCTPGLDARAAARSGVRFIIELLTEVGISPRLRDHGIAEDQLEALARDGFKSGARLLPNNPRQISIEDAIRIYQMAW